MIEKGSKIKKSKFQADGRHLQVPNVFGIHRGYTQAYPFGLCLDSFFSIIANRQNRPCHCSLCPCPHIASTTAPGTPVPLASIPQPQPLASVASTRSSCCLCPQSLSNSHHIHFAALTGAHARMKEEEREEWCGFLSRLESTLDWIGFPCHFFILGISNLRTRPIYSLMLHFQIPLDSMLQWCSRSCG